MFRTWTVRKSCFNRIAALPSGTLSHACANDCYFECRAASLVSEKRIDLLVPLIIT